jgi:hypothetical protein
VTDDGDEATPLRDVSTVHLGQFDRETANDIAGELEQAGIVWWYKEPGWLSSIWEFGVRLFVDRERLDEAKALVETVRARRAGGPGGGPGDGA